MIQNFGSKLWPINIYMGKNMLNVKTKNSDSPIWKDLMKVHAYYLQGRLIVTNSSDKTDFWTDN
jgi:ATP sulfurylase